MEAIKIRQTTEEDFEVIRKIRDDVYEGGDYLEDVYLEWINKPHITGYACEIDGKLVNIKLMKMNVLYMTLTNRAG